MAQEVELKLSLPPAAVPELARHPLLQQLASNSLPPRHLGNTYYDTPDLQLQQHRVALRIRRDGEQFIQTLKTRGSNHGGLHRRGEWEWPLNTDSGETPSLDTRLLPDGVIPESIALPQLVPIFSTDFSRQTWLLGFPGTDAKIELVLDQGRVHLPGTNFEDNLSETELELQQGDADQLFQLALQLTTDLPLRITRISKAERGYRLLHRQQGAAATAAVVPDSQAPAAQLDNLLQAIEGFEFAPDADNRDQLEAALAGFLDCATPARNAPGLSALRAVQQQLQSRVAEVSAFSALLYHQPLCLELLQWAYHCYGDSRS